MKSLRCIALLLAFLPGCDCRITKVTYGVPLESDTEDDLIELLKEGLAQCAKEGESDKCASDDDLFDDVRKLEVFHLDKSCQAGKQAQVLGVAGFSPGVNAPVVVGTFVQDWRENWSLTKIETKTVLTKYRACEVFGEAWRNEEVEYQSRRAAPLSNDLLASLGARHTVARQAERTPTLRRGH